MRKCEDYTNMENNKPSSKLDAFLAILGTSSKIIQILSGVFVLAALVYCGIKLIPLLSYNRTNIKVNNTTYDTAMQDWESGNYADAEKGLLLALQEAKNQYGEDDLVTAQVRQKLGALYIETARYHDAIEQLNPACVVFRKKLGEEDGMTITAKVQLSMADIHSGNFEQGYRDLNDTYDRCTNIEYKLQIAQNLAQCCMEMGDYAKAAQWYDVLEFLYQQFYGDSVMGTKFLFAFWNDKAMLYSNIGDTSSALKSFDKAKAYWMKYHDVSELSDAALSAYGDRELANILINEAITIVDSSGDITAATDCIDKALIICTKRLGEDNPETARCYSAVAGIYNAIQDKVSEKAYLDKALRIALNTVGENSELTASLYNAYGNYYTFWGDDYDTAVAYYERAINIRRNILNYTDQLTVYMYKNLANAKNQMHDFEGAIEAGRTALELCLSLSGENSTYAAEVYIELSRPLINTDQYAEAQELLDKAIALCRKYWQNGSITEAFAYNYQMKMYFRQEKYEDALTAGKISLDLFTKLQGERHSNTADAKLFLGDAYVFLGDASSADALYAQAAAVYQNVFSMETVHRAMDFRIMELIALESIDTTGMDYREIKDLVNELASSVTDEQINSRYAAWGMATDSSSSVNG